MKSFHRKSCCGRRLVCRVVTGFSLTMSIKIHVECVLLVWEADKSLDDWTQAEKSVVWEKNNDMRSVKSRIKVWESKPEDRQLFAVVFWKVVVWRKAGCRFGATTSHMFFWKTELKRSGSCRSRQRRWSISFGSLTFWCQLTTGI